jgi:hypothetical protein
VTGVKGGPGTGEGAYGRGALLSGSPSPRVERCFMVLMLAAFPGIGRYIRQQIKSAIFSLSAAREREHGASLPPPCSPMRWQESAARPGPAHESAARPGPSATQRLDRARPMSQRLDRARQRLSGSTGPGPPGTLVPKRPLRLPIGPIGPVRWPALGCSCYCS